MIPNLKNKLKAMSSNSPLHNPDAGNLERPVHEQTAYTENDGSLDTYEPIYKSINNGNKVDTDRKTVGCNERMEDFGGQAIIGAYGSFIRKRTIYGKSTIYGSVNLSDLWASSFSDNRWWTRLDRDICIQDIVLLDTETTGLAGGTGTYPFLIGIGYFTDNGLVIEQYLMRDFDEEYPMLLAVLDVLKNFRVLVTFNGKAFDWPLLESRFVYSRLRPLYWEDSHLDLLHVARRLWGNFLESCSLVSIEDKILKQQRKNDIPGQLIPKIYFDYLETRKTDAMKQVIKHNEWDIAALAALLIHISKLYKNPIGYANPHELLSIAKELERNHRIQEASECYKCCIDTAVIHSLKVDAKKRFAYLRKRHDGPEEAMNLWEELAGEEGSMLIFPLVEMAKYLEHGKKDYKKALECTERAIQLASRLRNNGDYNNGSSKLRDELFTRKRRLLKKIERSIEQWG
ncbi:MAG TPA: ribonuclease H-like domain-containing protein [Clostridiales bacterium]|nr:ribonuclease H-like domain-containing protein [Clostridiales bacterium]